LSRDAAEEPTEQQRQNCEPSNGFHRVLLRRLKLFPELLAKLSKVFSRVKPPDFRFLILDFRLI